MIRSFKCKEAEKIFNRIYSKDYPKWFQSIILRKLWMIDAAMGINDLRVPPANRLEKLSWDRSGQHSIRINNKYRICFNWKQDGAYNVEITDYH